MSGRPGQLRVGHGTTSTSKKCPNERKGRGNEVGNEQNTCLPRTPPPRMTREQSLKIELASIRANTLSSGIREKTESEGRREGWGGVEQRTSSDKAPSLPLSLPASVPRSRAAEEEIQKTAQKGRRRPRAVQGQKEDLGTSGGAGGARAPGLPLPLSLSREKSERASGGGRGARPDEDGNAK